MPPIPESDVVIDFLHFDFNKEQQNHQANAPKCLTSFFQGRLSF